MSQFQLKDGTIIEVDPGTLTPEQKARLRDLIATDETPSLFPRPEPRGFETGPQANQPEGRPFTWGERGRIASDIGLGFMGGGGFANPIAGGLNALASGMQSWKDVENQQNTMGPSRAADVTSAIFDQAIKRIPGVGKMAQALPLATDVTRGLLTTGATAAEMGREGIEIDPGTATALVGAGVGIPGVTGGFASLTRRAAPKSSTMVKERLEREIPQITGTVGEPGIAPGVPMDPHVRRSLERTATDIHAAVPALEATEQLGTGKAMLGATEAQQAAARTLPVAQAAQATKKERTAFEKARSHWELEQTRAKENVLELQHQLIDNPGDADLRHQLLDARFQVSQLRQPPSDVRDIAETLKRAKDTERKARQELAKARMRWDKVKSDRQAIHEVYQNVENVSGLRLEKLDPASKDILKRMAADSPEELVDNVFGRVFRNNDEPVDAGLARLEALEKAFGKNSGTMRALQISGAKRFLETAVDLSTQNPRQFQEFVERMGPGTMNKLFRNDKAYQQFLDLTQAIAASENMQQKRFWKTISVSLAPSGVLFFFPSIHSVTGNVEKAAAGLVLGGAANIVLEWDRITDLLLKNKVPLITKYIRELSTNPDSGRLGTVLAKQVHRYISSTEAGRQQPIGGQSTERKPVEISPRYFER